MKICIIFPAREVEVGKATMPVMPLAPKLLAALTPEDHEVSLVDMVYGDKVKRISISVTILSADGNIAFSKFFAYGMSRRAERLLDIAAGLSTEAHEEGAASGRKPDGKIIGASAAAALAASQVDETGKKPEK